ncbi:MAG TPA: ribosome biogenesis GTPase YlqF [Clostridiales bacterium]|jgi:ribosome biogenesis GTPase A|nr:ribosome biogenesis GTPase YlqF [Clostridiales bacterium]
MNIQWFPGHMTKAIREAEKNLKLIDALIYVLDARAPKACLNNHFLNKTPNKPVLYVLNKADLADSEITKQWIEYLSSETASAVSIIATKSGGARVILPELRKLTYPKVQRWKQKGVNYTPKAMVAGIPNTGKSSIINSLCGAYRAKTGNKPGVTREKQWIRLNDIELLDTAGILAPKLDDKDDAKHLAYIGSIKDDILDIVELARAFLDEMIQRFSQNIADRYGPISDSSDPLSNIAQSRGYLLKGGEIDLERTAKAVLDDFRAGRLGKITLENPTIEEDNFER